MNPTAKNNRNRMPQAAWHALSIDAVLEKVSSSAGGLTADEVAQKTSAVWSQSIPGTPKTQSVDTVSQTVQQCFGIRIALRSLGYCSSCRLDSID